MKQEQTELEMYIEKLRSHKAKMTPQRIEILNIFLANKAEHFTAEDIINRLEDSKTGQATVYRTLELFCNVGILKKVNFTDDEFTHYDLMDLAQHFHHHLICNSCHKVVEINDDLLESVEAIVSRDYHFNVQNHELILRGICHACQEGQPDE
jgi:Fur family transcriptional regulator, ferric uptake regulator